MSELFYIHEGHAAVYVKTGEFFKKQGGLKQRWGMAWRPVYADSIEAARALGKIADPVERRQNERRTKKRPLASAVRTFKSKRGTNTSPR